jgi:hypothetical protein
MKQRKDLKVILSEFGELAQMIKVIEELSELQKVICKMLNNRDNLKDYTTQLLDEVVDVEIMLDQIKLMFPNEPYDDWRAYKIEKCLKLIYERRLKNE